MKLTPGEVLHDPSFTFRDGETGNKLLVVLVVTADVCIIARTTSQPQRKSRGYGCHHDDFQPNFYLPLEARIFPKDTWVCLDYLTELEPTTLQARLAAGQIQHKVKITAGVLRELLECAQGAEDVTQAQAELIRKTLTCLI